MTHAYPADLAAFVHVRLGEQGVTAEPGMLEDVLSIAYQASLLREEGRPITFRLLVHPAEALSAESGPPDTVLRARLEAPRPFDEQEIRRIAPAARLARTMIGVSQGKSGELEIWGLVHTGASWLRELQGGRVHGAALPAALSVDVSGPGNVVVRWAGTTVARLANGVVVGRLPDVFGAEWLRQACTEPHADGAARSELARRLDQQFIARLVANVRLARHGGTIVLLPQRIAEEVVRARRPIALKYPFVDDPARRRYRTLVDRLVDVLGRSGGATWEGYVASGDREVLAIDDALLELARGVADLAAVDGVVLLSKRFEVMGFGGEIVGDLAQVPTVRRALDLDGERATVVSTEAVGTRHRSAYRLARAIPDALAFVVSQDGDVRLVASKSGDVTYWDQLGRAPLES